jgi:hypothetical protein
MCIKRLNRPELFLRIMVLFCPINLKIKYYECVEIQIQSRNEKIKGGQTASTAQKKSAFIHSVHTPISFVACGAAKLV